MNSKKVILWLLGTLLVLGIAGYATSKISPWPTALLLRYAFDYGADKKSEALEKYVPDRITTIQNQCYDPTDPEALLDVYYPENQVISASIVWIHGGGWLSGNKKQVANYCKILASKGFSVVSIDYALAPSVVYPGPVRQLNTALDYLMQNQQRLHIRTAKMILAGDSAGAQIAAQTAALLTSPEYAKLLGIVPKTPVCPIAGLVLYCGPYDIGKTDVETGFKGLARPILWSYSGTKDFLTDAYFKTASVNQYLTKHFPPAFISAGNGDDLLFQSQVLARHLGHLGVPVDTLFFPNAYTPKLPHEYQFDLDHKAGTTALQRSVQFITKLP
ncbi:alpha/beta hydrolase [Flavobacterium sp.]|uniref:alpha/beta hydrolase n=1 Tax=Flavobacterium sp. TaxID=239 RepID=UPI00261017B3|nr:alpha/beta hydrolase [Flavobacterium sp.]